MYGNTRLIAEAVARGLSGGTNYAGDVAVVPVGKATRDVLADADLIVVGGPTHVHSMSRPSTRKAAAEDASKHPERLALDPDSAGNGVREWLAEVELANTRMAAFDTRLAGPSLVTGQASRGITKALRKSGGRLVAKPESFLVAKGNTLVPDEETRAEVWGRELAKS